MRGSVLDRLEHGGRHGKHAGIAARDHRDMPAGHGELQGMPGAVHLDAVVAGVTGQSLALRHAGNVRDVTDQILRPVEGVARRFGEQARITRPEADDRHAP